MDPQQNNNPQNTENLKEIPKWTRKYAQNRTVPIMVSMVIFMLLFTGIALPSYFGGKAIVTGHPVLSGICFIVIFISMICLFITSIPKFGNKIINRISNRLYAKEGSAVAHIPESMEKTKWLGYLVAMIFGSCIIISVILGFLGCFPIKYMQPISALYFVPFTVFLYFWQRPMVSPVMLLWPILYTIHAILIVAGAPIQFDEPWLFFDMMIPTVGYGILSGLIGHIYSRHALKKLKEISHIEGDTANEI